MDKKRDPSICCLQEVYFRPEDTFNLKVRGWRTIYHATGCQKNAGVAILISEKLGFKLKTETRGEDGHYIIITGSIQKEELTFVNVYATNVREPEWINPLMINIHELIGKNMVITGNFNTPLTTMEKSCRQKLKKETINKEVKGPIDWTDIFRSFHPKAAEHTFFLSAHGTFSKIDHMLAHKTALDKCKRMR